MIQLAARRYAPLIAMIAALVTAAPPVGAAGPSAEELSRALERKRAALVVRIDRLTQGIDSGRWQGRDLGELYRVRGITVFEIESVDPVDFLGGKGLKVQYKYAPNDGIAKRGVCVARVVDDKLYAIKLEGVQSHYFGASIPEFNQLVESARLDTK